MPKAWLQWFMPLAAADKVGLLEGLWQECNEMERQMVTGDVPGGRLSVVWMAALYSVLNLNRHGCGALSCSSSLA